MITCYVPGCENQIKDHYWGKVKSGWFLQKDGTAYCVEHIPEWVEKWRSAQRSLNK